MFSGLKKRHIKIVTNYWMRFSLRSGGGLTALLLVLVTGLFVANIFITPVEDKMAEIEELGHSEGEVADAVAAVAGSEVLTGAVQWLAGLDDAEVTYLLVDQPALLSVIWLTLLACFPFLTSIAAFNQTAGDIGNRGLRYLLLRTERANIYLGRFLGTLFFSTASLVLLMILVSLYVGLKLRLYPSGDLMGSSLQGFLALFLISLPYIALCGWLSSLFNSAFASLAVCLLATGGSIVAFKIANGTTQTDLAWMERLTPWGWKYDLLSGDVGTRLLAYAVMLGMTATFMALGLRHFSKRDL